MGSGDGGDATDAARDLTRVSRETTSDSSEDMVFCVKVCCACNELDSSTADSSWFESIVRRRNSSSMTDSGLGECDR